MVSLTSLLVLTSLFSQTSQSIPKTSYLKLVDIWFIVLMVYNFLIIVSLVLIEFYRLRQENNPFKSSNKIQSMILVNHQTRELKTENSQIISRKINQLSKTVFPLILIVFLSIFGSIAINNLNQ